MRCRGQTRPMTISKSKTRATRGSKRGRFLEEAARALNSRGISQTSLADLAKSIGVSRAALYYYFEDQQDLVFQSYRRSCEMMSQCLAQAAAAGLEQNDDALTVITHFIDLMLGDQSSDFASLSEVAFLHPEQRNIIINQYDMIVASLVDILHGGARTGELRSCDTMLAAHSIIGLVSWISMAKRWGSNTILSQADMLAAIKHLLSNGMAADRKALIAYRPMDMTRGAVHADNVFNPEAMAAAKQEALLASASWLFNLKGVDATSLEEIAMRVGVTKKVIYHNVGDKETLLIACHRRAFRIWEDIAQAGLSYDGSRLEAVCMAMYANTEASLREEWAALSSLAGFEALPQDARAEVDESALRLMTAYLQILGIGQKEGSISVPNARAFMAMAPGTFQWLPKWHDRFTPAQRAAAPREIADLIRFGLRAV